MTHARKDVQTCQSWHKQMESTSTLDCNLQLHLYCCTCSCSGLPLNVLHCYSYVYYKSKTKDYCSKETLLQHRHEILFLFSNYFYIVAILPVPAISILTLFCRQWEIWVRESSYVVRNGGFVFFRKKGLVLTWAGTPRTRPTNVVSFIDILIEYHLWLP